MKISKFLLWLGIPVLLAIAAGAYIRYDLENANMAYAAWKKANSAQNLVGKNVLVIGGTQGIGAGIATRFSQIGASVAIAGRNEALANQVLEDLRTNSSAVDKSEFKFFRFDATSISDMDRFTKEARSYFEGRGGLDYLVQSQGLMNSPLSSRTNTSEGHDSHFMVNGYSKYFLTDRFAPILKGAAVFIFAPSRSGSINFDDVELMRNAPFMGPTTRDTTFTDAVTLEFQKRYPNVRFFHLYPGLVATDVLKNTGFSSFWNSALRGLASYLGRTTLEFSDFPVYVALNPSEFKESRYSQKAVPIRDYDWIKSEENRKRLFDWSKKTEDAVLTKSNL